MVGIFPVPSEKPDPVRYDPVPGALARARAWARERGLVVGSWIHSHPSLYHARGPSEFDLEQVRRLKRPTIRAVYLVPERAVVWYGQGGVLARDPLPYQPGA